MFNPKNFGPQRVIGIISSVDRSSLEWESAEIPCIEFSLMVGENTDPKLILRIYVRNPKLCQQVARHITEGTRLVIDGNMEKDEPNEDVFVAKYIAADLQYVSLIVNPTNAYILRKPSNAH